MTFCAAYHIHRFARIDPRLGLPVTDAWLKTHNRAHARSKLGGRRRLHTGESG